ncbi:hypothetical protein [Streptomyces sp. NBC_01304]|uniref:hypothetical protein n=1 Tax=Streptomyces sp. NBC_01304 TaxID=2903818 RepID=UPI002E0EA240|nr:hypothetical protein OG430_15550 [Streptomyces sp. NBC_01304]
MAKDRGGEQDGASIPDEEWERFLREAEAEPGTAPREPSARERQRTARTVDAEHGWRTYRPGGTEQQRRGARRKKRIGYAAAGLLALGLAVLALNPAGVLDPLTGAGEDRTPLAVETARPDGAPSGDGAAEQPTVSDPFKGSPALRWGNGLDGIGFPEARATGWMGKAEVARALRKTRDFLSASNLNPVVLSGERPVEAIKLINPRQPDMRTFLKDAFRKPSRESDPLMLFSRFDRTKVRPVGDVVKTRGRVTYKEGEDGALEVTADVTYVYPVVRTEGGSDEVARTIVRRELVMSWDDPSKVNTEAGTFSLRSFKADRTNGGCDNLTGYFRPEFRSDRSASGTEDGPESDPYDRSPSIDELMEGDEDKCGLASRS